MKRQDMSKLAVMGLMSGLLVSSQASSINIDSGDKNNETVFNALAAKCGAGTCGASTGYRGDKVDPESFTATNEPEDRVFQDRRIDGQIGERDFREKLSKNHRDIFDKFTPEQKQRALEHAKNACKGQAKCHIDFDNIVKRVKEERQLAPK